MVNILLYKREGVAEGNTVGSRVRKIWFCIPALLLLGRWLWHSGILLLRPPVEGSWWHTRRLTVFSGADVWTGLGPHSCVGEKSWFFFYHSRVDQGLTYTNQLHKWLTRQLNSIFILLDIGVPWAGKRHKAWILPLIHAFPVSNYMRSQTLIKPLLGEHRSFHILNKWFLVT